MRFVVLATIGLLCARPRLQQERSSFDAGIDAGRDAAFEGPITKKNVGSSCETNDECVSNICYANDLPQALLGPGGLREQRGLRQRRRTSARPSATRGPTPPRSGRAAR